MGSSAAAFAASAFGGVLLTGIFFSFIVLGSDGVTFCPVGAWNALFYDRGHGFAAFVATVIWRLSLLSQDFLMGGISFEAGDFEVLTAMYTSLRTFSWASLTAREQWAGHRLLFGGRLIAPPGKHCAPARMDLKELSDLGTLVDKTHFACARMKRARSLCFSGPWTVASKSLKSISGKRSQK